MSEIATVTERAARDGATAPKVSIVVPVSSPHADVQTLVVEYSRELEQIPVTYEFVFVLDGIAGSVLATLDQLRLADAPIKIVTLQGGGLGESIAMTAGAQKASGEFIITAPQYLQIEPREVRKLLSELEAGHDFVTPWRRPRVDPWLNRVQSALFNWVLRFLCRMKFHDLNCFFRGMRKQVLEEVNVYGDLYRFLPIMAHRQGFRVKEVAVQHREEVGRRGFFGVGVYLRRLLDILAVTFLTRFTQKPLRFFGTIGLLLIVVALALAVHPIYQKLFETRGVTESVKFLVAVVMFAFGVQFIGFGLVGEIIIFTQASKVQDYKIDRFYDTVSPPRPAAVGMTGVAVGPGAVAPRWVPARPTLVVRPLGPGEDSWWDEYVLREPVGTFFHLTGWKRVVESVFGHVPHYLVAEDGGVLRGVLPLFQVKSMFLGRSLISVPYGVYGGILAADRDAELALLGEAVARAERTRVRYLELRNHRDSKLGLTTSELYATYIKELPVDPEQCLEVIPRKARAEARRGRDKGGFTLEDGCPLPEFYRLFAANKRGLGSPALPLRMFEAIVKELGPQAVLHRVAAPDGGTVAAVMSFRFRDTLMAYYSGARDDSEHLGVNNFMYWKLTEWAVRQGFRRFDFGRSRVGTGPAAFKKNMGYEAQPLAYQYHLVGDGQLPDFHPGNPRLNLPKRIWRRLPTALATPLGGWLSRYLP